MNSEIQEPVEAISDTRSSSKSPLRILVMMLAVLFGLLVYQNFRPTEYDEFIGQKFDYSGVSYSGKVINRESLQGSVVVVNFWATYCPFCLEDIEHLKDLQQALRHNDFKILCHYLNYAYGPEYSGLYLSKGSNFYYHLIS